MPSALTGATLSGWDAAKVANFRAAFFKFLSFVLIDSKDKGTYCLADGLYDAQLRFLNGILDGLSNDIHDFKCLKSRQLGISTISEAIFVFFLGMFPGIQASVIFDTSGHLKDCRDRIRKLIKRLPESFKFPGILEDSRDLMTLEGGATIRWVAAGVREQESSGGLGRSAGCNLIWGSEISSWKNTEGIQSLIESLSTEYPNRLYIWESTARGYNAWKEIYDEAKLDDLNQRAIFIGWWAKPNQRFERNDPRFERYGATPPTKEEQTIIDDVLRDYGHQITQEQLAWYRYKMDPTREAEKGERKGGQYRVQEQPSREIDAFQQSGSSFFDHLALNTQATRVSQWPRAKHYRYTFGTEFTHTIITPAVYWRDIQLSVWDEPEKGARYVIAADPAFGRNPNNDRSALQVLQCYADCVEQVAEFADATTDTTKFAWVIASVAAWYATEAEAVDVIIEIDGPGEAVWKEWEQLPRLLSSPYMRHEAQARGLSNIFGNVRNYIYSRSDAMSQRGNNWQWKTGNRKEAIMEKLKALVNAQQAIVKSMQTIEEMRTVARDGSAIEAPSGRHDDRTVALAIGVRNWEDHIRPGLLARGRTRAAWKDARKMTTVGRLQTYMDNSLSAMFRERDKRARFAEREARIARHRRR